MNQTNLMATDRKRLCVFYAKALGDTAALASPEELKEALMRISEEPKFQEVFPNGSVPPELKALWLAARSARERYLTEFAHEVLQLDPAPESRVWTQE